MVEIRTIRPRMVARIYCSDAFYQLDHNAQRERLRHEVLHLVLDPIWEEVDFQLLHGNSDRYKEYRARFVRQLEKVVEHLARAPAFAAESMI